MTPMDRLFWTVMVAMLAALAAGLLVLAIVQTAWFLP